MNRTPLGLALFVVSSIALADCKDLNASIDASQRELAMEESEAGAESSAIRDIARQQRIANINSRIQTNLTLMKEQKCKLPKGPITGKPYELPALLCRLDRTPEKCDQSNWKR